MTPQNRYTDTIAIKKRMVEKGFDTILQLSEKTRINRNTLGKILDGTAQPSADVMNRLVEALDISAAEAGQIFFANNLRNT